MSSATYKGKTIMITRGMLMVDGENFPDLDAATVYIDSL